MKKFITILVLILSLQSWTIADDIRDFEIEGMSIGDSALDHFTQKEIEKNFRDWYPNQPFRYFEFSYLDSFKTYDNVGFIVEKDDDDYKIYSISGMKFCKKSIQDCYKTRDEIDKELLNLFKNQKRELKTEKYDEDNLSGKNSVAIQTIYTFQSGDGIVLEIRDWGTNTDFRDNTAVHLDTKQMREWLGM